MKNKLVWFRNDLRINDNTALYHACSSYADKVISLFIDTPEQWNYHGISKKKISFVHQHIIILEKKLSELNIPLYYYISSDFFHSVKYLINFCKKYNISHLFYNYQYEINERNRDYLVKKKLSEKGIFVKGFHDNLLVSHKDIKSKYTQTYKIFSFFKKKLIHCLSKKIPTCFPIPFPRKIDKQGNFKKNFIKHSQIQFDTNIFPIGEDQAIKRLKYFILYKENKYSINRNFPCIDGTSLLSPYLSSGVISLRYCLKTIIKYYHNIPLLKILNLPWVNEIIWREFYYHLLIGYPFLSKSQALSTWEKKIKWKKNIDHFNAWKNGTTGFPIIDAGMKQLKKIGWMHNRLRMITASFLVKNLFIDWREGEKYFMSQLIDGDFALNNGGWQWSASIGTDFISYIRMFNPFVQSKKFDKSGIFIKKYLPELSIIPDNYIHNPYQWLKKNNYQTNYPKPIVDYNNTRKKTLFIYNQIRLKKKNKKEQNHGKLFIRKNY